MGNKLAVILVIIILMVLFGVSFYGLQKLITKVEPANLKVDNFEQCLKAGNPVMESYPRQCKTPAGKIFIEQLTNKEKIQPPKVNCLNLCGDDICQEIVCLALGCPCAEDPQTCPEDCQEKSF